MSFNSCSILRQGYSLALAPKKSIALQAGGTSSLDVFPISSRSRTNVVALLAGQVPPMVAPTPSAGQAGTEAEEAPWGVTEQTIAEVALPPTLERTELPPALVAPPMVGAAPQVEAPVS